MSVSTCCVAQSATEEEERTFTLHLMSVYISDYSFDFDTASFCSLIYGFKNFSRAFHSPPLNGIVRSPHSENRGGGAPGQFPEN